jgi:hypothetical protein
MRLHSAADWVGSRPRRPGASCAWSTSSRSLLRTRRLSARSHPPKARHRFEGWWKRPTGCTLRQLVAVATIKPEEQVMVIGSSAAMPVAGALGLFAIVIVGFLRAMLKGV